MFSKPSFRSLTLWVVALLLSMLSAGEGKSQDMEVGLAAGGSYYIGDLNPAFHFRNTKPAFGLVARYNIDTRWAAKVSATMGNVSGSSYNGSFIRNQDISFTSKITDIAGTIEFNFLPYFTGSYRSRFSPYIFGGVSVFLYDPVSGGKSLRSLGTEGQNIGYLGRSPYSSASVSIPFGLGVKYSLSRRLGMQVYWEMHKTFTDYVDDVSTTYYLSGKDIADDDLAGRMSDPVRRHEPGMQRGNSGNKDWFAFVKVAVTYHFSLISRKKCREADKN